MPASDTPFSPFETDLDDTPDGICQTDDEQLAYYFASNQIRRASGATSCDGGAALLDLPPDGAVDMELAYFDAAGAEIADPSANLDDIRRVRITVTVEEPNPHPDIDDPIATTVIGSAALRNG